MSVIKFKANGDPKRSELQDKAGIWFCCHPDDLEKYFESISEDILRLHNCVICYDEEPEADYDEEELFECLRNMWMIVVPVTKTFLNEKSRARDVELPSAVYNDIHVLPVVMEPDIDDKEYESVFGRMHYLNGYICSKDQESIWINNNNFFRPVPELAELQLSLQNVTGG